MKIAAGLSVLALTFLGTSDALGQGLLPTYPGYANYQRMAQEEQQGALFVSGAVTANWSGDGSGFDYQWNGQGFHFNFATGRSISSGQASGGDGGGGGGRGGFGGGRGAGGGGRGQAAVIGGGGGLSGGGTGSARVLPDSAKSPDGRFNAVTHDNNLFLKPADGPEIPVTTDGSTKTRVRYGLVNIAFGEDLGLPSALWWSPDSKKLAYFRFDESKVEDYYIPISETTLYNHAEIDAYPKVGTPGAIPDIYVYDVEKKQSVKLDVRDGKRFADSTVGFYVYRPSWASDSAELLFSRMDRKQDTLELAAGDPATGKCRVIVHEERLANWTDWAPTFEYFPDHKRFIWSSERTDFKHYYLYEMNGKLDATLTHGDYEVAGLVKIDEAGGHLFYMARDGDNYMKLQLHRVNLDGTGDVRLTDVAFNHAVQIAPDNRHFIDVYQTHDQPPASRVMEITDAGGKIVAELAKGNMDRMKELGLRPAELFTFKTFDGTAELFGMLNYPANFDASKKYPVLLSVYGGPNTTQAKETFSPPIMQMGNMLPPMYTEYGFLVAQVDARSQNGRGRKFSDPFYHHLGIVEMDDQAAGVKSLFSRPYVNAGRVGVYGTSYGGTTAATLLMRYPDIFAAASSSSPVTDYRNYNCIYAERNEGQLSENKAGYDAATVMTYVPNLRGALQLYYGTADNNVHNTNVMQLISALQAAKKNFELQVGVDKGHTAVNQARMMEFFIENLVMK